MGLEFKYDFGQTPLDEEERQGLKINSITSKGELDEFEQLNIENAVAWTMETKLDRQIILTEIFVKKLHKRMFGDVWKWGGKFRNSQKNLGIIWTQIGIELKKLLDDINYWIDNETYSAEEIAIRFKHRIVTIHCFPNGNGRHSRLMADIIMESIFKRETFTWHQSNMVKADETRKKYIEALKKADNGNIIPLIEFAKN
ncbi:MAG: mobile mystery protein B [Saprospiraceae bacterium]|nr:mobile mystery protein B [Saprospiraceae bacterium]